MTTDDAPSTVDAPWPVGLLSTKIKGWIERLGTAWVEGEITQWGVSGGNVYGKLKDLEADATVSFTVWSSTRAKLPADLRTRLTTCLFSTKKDISTACQP